MQSYNIITLGCDWTNAQAGLSPYYRTGNFLVLLCNVSIYMRNDRVEQIMQNISKVTRKSVFGVSDQVRQKQGCTARGLKPRI